MNEIYEKEWEVLGFGSPEKLLGEADKINILLLDIEMPQMDGIETGKRMMKLNSKCKIIMATSRIDRFKEAFKIKAFRFITKPFAISEVREAIASSLVSELGDKEIEVFKNRISLNIKETDILFVRAFNGYVEIIAGNELYRKDITMSTLEDQLDDRLLYLKLPQEEKRILLASTRNLI